MHNGKRIIALLLCAFLMIPMISTALAVDTAATGQAAQLALTEQSVVDFENGKTLQAQIKAANPGAQEISTELILAMYETSTNEMVGYTSKVVKIPAKGEQTWTGSLEVPAEGSYSLKAFAWDSLEKMNLQSNVLKIAQPMEQTGTVTVSIEKRTIGKGDLLPAEQVPLLEGDTAWSVLKRTMDEHGYTYEAQENHTYGSIYVQSIEGDGERDHGATSGWMYCVNDKFPDQGMSVQKLADGDILRVRYTVSSGDLRAPLVNMLKKLVEDTELTLAQNHGQYTYESEQAARNALDEAKRIAEDEQYNSPDADKELVVSSHIAAINNAVANLRPGDGIPSDSAIPSDWENDIWLNSDFERLSVGDTYEIYARRLPELVEDTTQNNGLTLPPMHYTVMSGKDVVSVSETGVVTALNEGVAVIQVRYDEVQPDWSTEVFGACSPVNYAYMTVEVNNAPADVEIITDLNTQTKDESGVYQTKGTTFDTVYFTDGESVDYTFAASAAGAELNVTCNGQPLTGENGIYTAQLENRTNVIQIQAVKDGKTKVQAYSIDARKIEISVNNLSAPGQTLSAGDKAAISFKGIVIPVSKLATIYNPCFGDGSWGDYASGVQYTLNGETVYGRCKQWDLATKNTITITFDKAGDYTFTDGCIDMWWWGQEPGYHKTVTGPGQPGLGSPTQHAKMSTMPQFTVKVNEAGTRPVEGIEVTPKTATGEVVEGEGHTIQLSAQVQPVSATNKNVTWRSSDDGIATVDAKGLVTCVSAGPVTITAKSEDGGFEASASITVVQELPATDAERSNLRRLLADVSLLKKNEYTPESWSKLETARDAAQKVLDAEGSLVAQVESAYKALAQAKKELQPGKLNLMVKITPEVIHPGDQVTIVLENLEIPQPGGVWNDSLKTVYQSDIPELAKVESADGKDDGTRIRTLTFTVPAAAKPGSYTLTGGYVFCQWVVNPQFHITEQKNYYEGRMPDIQIEVVAKDAAAQEAVAEEAAVQGTVAGDAAVQETVAGDAVAQEVVAKDAAVQDAATENP